MIGEHKSLQRLLKNQYPNLTHIRCSCHSFDLAARHAMKNAMPSHLEVMIRDSYNWFSLSSLRQQKFQQIVELLGTESLCDDDNDEENEENGEQRKSRCLKLLTLSDTRWLVLSDCIERILLQYEALKLHFQLAYEGDHCFTAKTLHEMYLDEKNKLLLLFLHPILKTLKKKTLLLQSNQKDPMMLLGDFKVYFTSLAGYILKNSIITANSLEDLCNLQVTEFCLLNVEDVNYGSVFLNELQKSKLSNQEKFDLKKRAKSFLVHLFVGLQTRMVGIFKLQRKIQHFSKAEFFGKKFKVGDFPAPFFDQSLVAQSEILAQCDLIKNDQWTNDSDDTEKFWLEVHNRKNALGEYPYQGVSKGVLKILCLPVSNAEVERVFSQVNVIKDRKRSQMALELLESVLYIKFGLSRLNEKSQTFIPPKSLCKFNSSIYN